MNSDKKTRIIEELWTDLANLITGAIPEVDAAYLFGSVAQGTTREDSDLDLAILMDKKPDGEAVHDLKTQISYKYKTDVDLVDLHRADTVSCAQVVSTGVRIYMNPEKKLDVQLFESNSLSQYARLNLERASILEQIKKDGKIND
jgi:uncharacterized protein